ncbi:MAG: MFS transporter [Pseudomonadota bacterium]
MSVNTTETQASRDAPLFFQRRFLPMWTGFVLGAFADNVLRQALIIGIGFGAIGLAGVDSGAAALPYVGSLFAFAMLVFSGMAGQIADKYETALLLRRTKLVEVIIMAMAAVGFILGAGWFLVLTLFLMGVQSAFFSPVRIGAMPKYLRADELIQGNAICNSGLFVAILSGLAIGGVLIEAPNGALLLGAVLFLSSASGWLAILKAPKAAPNAPDLKLNFNPLTQTVRVLRYAFQAPGVAPPLLGAAAFYFVSTFVTVLIPVYIQRAWGADGGAANFAMALFAIGAGLGAISASALSRGKTGLVAGGYGVAAAAGLSLLVYGLGLAAPAPPNDAPLMSLGEFLAVPITGALCVAFCLSAASLGFFMVPMQAAAQRRAPTERRARVLAAGNILNAGAAALGSLAVLFVTQGSIAPNYAFLLVGALCAGVAAVMAWRRSRMAPGLHD